MAPHAAPVLVERDEVVTVISTIRSLGTGTPTPTPAKRVDVGPIVGGLVGGLAAGLLVAGFVIWFIHNRRKRRKEAMAVLRRRQERLAAQRRAKERQSSVRLQNVSEKGGFDPQIPVPAPKRPSKSYAAKKQYDPFASDRGYGYEPQPLQYVPAGGDYFVQQPYEQPATQHEPPQYETENPSSTHHSPPSSPRTSTSSKRSSRSKARAAAAEKAAIATGKPVASRHRPARPSPLASNEDVPNQSESIDFTSPRPSSSPSSDIFADPSPSDPSSPTVEGDASWGIALGDPSQDVSPGSSQHKHSSSQYSSDPFAEYHMYEKGMGYDEQQVAPSEEDATVINHSQHSHTSK